MEGHLGDAAEVGAVIERELHAQALQDPSCRQRGVERELRQSERDFLRTVLRTVRREVGQLRAAK